MLVELLLLDVFYQKYSSTSILKVYKVKLHQVPFSEEKDNHYKFPTLGTLLFDYTAIVV